MAGIGEAARRSGINIETIRYYEREGIIPAAPRTPGGRRDYSDGDIALLLFVKRCRDLGFPIADVRALLALRHASNAQCREVQQMSEHHLNGIRAKIAELRRLETSLTELIAECGKGRVECPALRELFTGAGEATQ